MEKGSTSKHPVPHLSSFPAWAGGAKNVIKLHFHSNENESFCFTVSRGGFAALCFMSLEQQHSVRCATTSIDVFPARKMRSDE